MLLEVQVISVDMDLSLQHDFQPHVAPQNEPDGREASLEFTPITLWCSEWQILAIKPLVSIITTHGSHTCFGSLGWDGAMCAV